jgi:hypothetical protein
MATHGFMTDLLAFLVDIFGAASLTNSHRQNAHKVFGFSANAIRECVLNVFRPHRPIAVGAVPVNSRTIFDISFVHISRDRVSAVMKAPTANLILHQPELYIDRGTAWCTGNMQFVSECANWLQKLDLKNVATAVNLVGDEMPRRNVGKTYAALGVDHCGRLPHHRLLPGEIVTASILVPRTPGNFLP